MLPAFLLAFPFGLFGAHRFYVGKIGTAFAQLGAFVGCILMIIACATTGADWQPALGILLGFSLFGCFIWAVTDWILILCKAFTDGQGRRMSSLAPPAKRQFEDRYQPDDRSTVKPATGWSRSSGRLQPATAADRHLRNRPSPARA